MNKAEMLLAAKMLEMASDEFSNHGCNDFDLSEYMTDGAVFEFVKHYHEVNGDPEVFLEDVADSLREIKYWLGDSSIMWYLATKLEKEAEGMNDR